MTRKLISIRGGISIALAFLAAATLLWIASARTIGTAANNTTQWDDKASKEDKEKAGKQLEQLKKAEDANDKVQAQLAAVKQEEANRRMLARLQEIRLSQDHDYWMKQYPPTRARG